MWGRLTTAFYWGNYADVHGRKPVINIGLVWLIITSIAFGNFTIKYKFILNNILFLCRTQSKYLVRYFIALYRGNDERSGEHIKSALFRTGTWLIYWTREDLISRRLFSCTHTSRKHISRLLSKPSFALLLIVSFICMCMCVSLCIMHICL